MKCAEPEKDITEGGGNQLQLSSFITQELKDLFMGFKS
jgi:hypothetical protein